MYRPSISSTRYNFFVITRKVEKKPLTKPLTKWGVLMDLSKAFDTLDHEPFVMKLHVYVFGKV